jgi:glycosyltransferase involved in cell wall biosynthesis
MTLEIVFWLSVGALAYAWIGYPIALALLGGAPPARRRGGPWQPRLSVIVAAYNEAPVIAAKIRSTLDQRYAADRLEVIVVSDGSTDGTDDIVRAHRDPRVRLVRQDPRAGKSAALNAGVAAARGEILVFTDANAMFVPDALLHLAAPFRDPGVGLVSGVGLYAPAGPSSADGARAAGSGYARYEAFVKRGEGALGFLAAADGAIYALRRALYRPMHPWEVNDLLHPIQAALAGFSCRFDARACTVEPPSSDAGAEFRRHVRIIAQGVQLLRCWLPPLVRARRGRALWALVSHRLLRWTEALWLAGALLSSVALAPDHPIYAAALGLQVAFYALAAVGLAAERRGIALGRLALPAYFCVVSAAGLAGLARGLRQGADATWTPRGQARVEDQAA